VKLLRTIFLALLFSLLLGLLIGTAIRTRLEKPVTYIGASEALPIASDRTLVAVSGPVARP